MPHGDEDADMSPIAKFTNPAASHRISLQPIFGHVPCNREVAPVKAKLSHLALLAAALVLVMKTSASSQDSSAVVVGPLLHVRPTDQLDGTPDGQIVAAANESRYVQIVVQAGAAGLTNVTVDLAEPLTGDNGTVPTDNVMIYREAYFDVTRPSSPEYGTYPDGSWQAWGRWPDALIPTVDPYFHERRNAFPVNIPAGENRVALVDVLVPQDAAPGSYDGAISVTADGFNVTLPLNLEVLDFALPKTSSLSSLFGSWSYSAACRAVYGDDCYRAATEEEGWRLNALYARAALDNRITLFAPHYQPLVTDTQRNFFRQYTLPLLNGTAPTRLPGAMLTSFAVDHESREQIAGWKAEAELQGFADRSFVYACDEPGQNPAGWAVCQQHAALAHDVWPAVPILVTANIRDARQFGATGYTNWIVPIIQDMEDKPGHSDFGGNQRPTYDDFLAMDPRNRVFHYLSCVSHGCGTESCANPPLSGPDYVDPYFGGWPDYAIDESPSKARAMGWQSFRYNTSGELYYAVDYCLSRRPQQNTTAWTTQFSFGSNGDGNLLYPGDPAIIGGTSHIPIESLRMKLIRDGYQDYEYLKILSDRGQRDEAMAVADSLFPTMYSTQDRDVEAARSQLIDLIQSPSDELRHQLRVVRK
jgi:hypothetical protein